MKLQIGDKVSFISEKREGIVKKIINPTTVSVEIEDGFEIPVLVSDLIKISIDSKTPNQYYDNSQAVKVESENDYVKSNEEDDSPITPLFKDDSLNDNSLFIAFEPVNQNNFLSEGFNLYFINHTSNDILFACYIKNEHGYVGYIYDAISPMSKYLVSFIDKEELNKWASQLYHCIFFNAKGGEIRQPLVKEIDVNVVKFFKDNNFVFSKILNSKSYIIPFIEDVIPNKWEEEEFMNEKIDPIPLRDIKEMFKGNVMVQTLDKKHVIAPFIAEVDLHIEQLIDDCKDLSSHQKLNVQLNYFAKCLDAAIVHKFKKITYIHGVGQGRLKDEIHKIIIESYPGVKIQDAPFKKFGVGATEVLIPFNLTR